MTLRGLIPQRVNTLKIFNPLVIDPGMVRMMKKTGGRKSLQADSIGSGMRDVVCFRKTDSCRYIIYIHTYVAHSAGRCGSDNCEMWLTLQGDVALTTVRCGSVCLEMWL